MSLIIGEIIRERINELGWSVAKFSRDVEMSYRNAMYLFKRSEISLEQLRKISKVLDFDFVSVFHTMKVNGINDEISELPKSLHTVKSIGINNEISMPTEPLRDSVTKDFTTMVMSITIVGDSNTYEQFPAFLKKIREYAQEIGFKVI